MPAPDRLRLSDASIRIDNTPTDGRELTLNVPEHERAVIAEQLGVTSVDRLEVRLNAVRFRGGFRVSGRLDATVTQPSVVSLEPVTEEISEPIDRVFLPGGEKDYAGPANAEIFVDLEGDELPDHFDGNEADLSDLLIETLALGIDPYPRLPGESVEAPADDEPEAEDNPFAALKALKDRPDED